ncbi:UPF0158 family protein [Pseudomonas alloputida]|uniref:UPF0158 family protein n=1 Tax=Pseudomonas TaxID=286 RepID=UPI000EB4B33E|nr:MULTISPECIES: UPF0158 family protein [Pseudomonas]BBV98446.1 hypothetical protein STW0522PSE72_37970 [Pseudomonas monteilii]
MDPLYIQNAILELLKGRPSEVGARLKQRLNRTLVDAGHQALNEQQFGYRKFSDFLSGELSQHVTVEKSAAGGDITVFLKAVPTHFTKPFTPQAAAVSAVSAPAFATGESGGTTPCASAASKEPVEASSVVRGDVWQAFSNLNPCRKRYLDRRNGQVVHFLLDAQSDQEALVDEQPQRFAEITYVEGDMQKQWMHAFLSASGLPEDDVSSLERLLDEPYSSKLNLIFGRALGQRQADWKRYRAQRMGDIIEKWAEANRIGSHMLKANRGGGAVSEADLSTPALAGAMGAREQALRLLAMMDEREIVTVAIPAMLGCVLAKSRF